MADVSNNSALKGRNAALLGGAYAQRGVEELHQAYFEIQPYQTDPEMEILTTNDFETIYCNGPKYTGLPRVEPSEELAEALNEVGKVNHINIRQQIVTALEDSIGGQWYATGDESNLIFHNHPEENLGKEGLVYRYNDENGEVLKVTITHKEIYGAHAIQRASSASHRHMGEQTRIATLPTSAELNDIDPNKVAAKASQMREKTPEEKARDKRYELMAKENQLRQLGYVEIDGEWKKVSVFGTGGAPLGSLSSTPLGPTLGRNQIYANNILGQGVSNIDKEDAALIKEVTDLRASIREQERKDAEGTAAARRQALAEWVERNREIEERKITLTGAERARAILSLKEQLNSGIFDKDDERLILRYLASVEKGTVTKEEQKVFNDIISKYQGKLKPIKVATGEGHYIYYYGQPNTLETQKVQYIYSRGSGRYPGGPMPIIETSTSKAKDSFGATELVLTPGLQYELSRMMLSAKDAGQLLLKSVSDPRTKFYQEVKRALVSEGETQRFIEAMIEEFRKTRDANTREGKIFCGFKLSRSKNGNLNYQPVWKRAEKSAELDIVDISLAPEDVLEIVTAGNKQMAISSANSHKAGRKAANRALNNMRKAKLKEVEVQMQVVGRPSLKAGIQIKVFNIGQRYSGQWYVKTCIHEIDSGSPYTTSLTLVKNAETAQGKVKTVKIQAESESKTVSSRITIESRNPDGSMVKVNIDKDTMETNMAILDQLKSSGEYKMAAAAQVLINSGRVIHTMDEEGNPQIDYELLQNQIDQIEEEKEAFERDVRNRANRIKQITKLQKETQEAKAKLAKTNAKDPKSIEYAAKTLQSQAEQGNQYAQMIQDLTAQAQNFSSQATNLLG